MCVFWNSYLFFIEMLLLALMSDLFGFNNIVTE